MLIYIHKELALKDVEARYPSLHYVLVDDKPHFTLLKQKLRPHQADAVDYQAARDALKALGHEKIAILGCRPLLQAIQT